MKKFIKIGQICLTLIIIIFVSSLMMLLLSKIIYYIQPSLFQNNITSTALMYLSSGCIGIICLIFMKVIKKNRYMFQKLTFHKKYLIYGLCLGFIGNFLFIVSAFISSDLTFTFYTFSLPGLILLLICVFIQSSSEELVCRLIIYEKLIQEFSKTSLYPLVINSFIFASLHIFNSGMTIIAFINIWLVGMILSIPVYLGKGLWMSFGMHTAWNYTQAILFGLPNSGIPAKFSLLGLVSSKSSIFYDTYFGIEGSLFVTIIFTLILIIFFLYVRKKQNTV